jgi:hypothetical protein
MNMPDFSSLFAQPATSNFYNATAQAQPQFQSNLLAAADMLKLNPQERALYQRHIDNLTGSGGVDNPPDAQNPQGSRSTLYQAVQEGPGGKFYSIPTVWNGKREVEPYTKADGSTMDVPNKTALQNVEKAGWNNFPSYATPDEADQRYQLMHSFMDGDTQRYLKTRGQ